MLDVGSLDRIASAANLGTTWTRVLSADVASKVSLFVNNAVWAQFAGTTAPANLNSAVALAGNQLYRLSVPAGRNLWLRRISGSGGIYSVLGLVRYPPPNGPSVFTAERSAAGQATIKWEPEEFGIAPTGINLRYRRRNNQDTNWGSWSNVTGEDFASGEDVITGLTAGARRYQFGLVFTAPSGNSEEAYVEVRV